MIYKNKESCSVAILSYGEGNTINIGEINKTQTFLKKLSNNHRV